MKNIIKVKDIFITDNKIKYDLDIEGEVKKFFKIPQQMYIEYNFDIQSIPNGIAIIPLLVNILPIAWFSDSEIVIEEIDKTFYESIEKIKLGYINMHKNANLNGKLFVKKIIDYKYIAEERYGTFFSGGVDSLSTLINNLDKKPDLISVWGADVRTYNLDGWNKVEDGVVKYGRIKGLNNVIIKSNFTEFINQRELDIAFSNSMNDNWWHGAQHGIGLIGLAVPHSYINKLKTVYVPATFTEKDGVVSCASYPTIDNEVKFAGCNVIHEGFENTRQDKVGIITRHIKSGNDLLIRVCFRSDEGDNCNKCEKCGRTIMALIAEGIDPNTCGFKVTRDVLKDIRKKLKNEWIMPDYLVILWNDIQDKFNENKDLLKNKTSLNWFLNFDIVNENNKKFKRPFRIKRKLIKIFSK